MELTMKIKNVKLAREQLDATLGRLGLLKEIMPPKRGWICAIRTVLGMTGEQLAKRLNVNKQRISRIEHDENLGKVKLDTLKKVADALDCEFVYAFIPKQSLEQTVRKQAQLLAIKRMYRSNQMMRLEKQELSQTEKNEVTQNLINEIVNTMPKSLWDEK
jgi:predicted DNA-binding mobile mystery protein A